MAPIVSLALFVSVLFSSIALAQAPTDPKPVPRVESQLIVKKVQVEPLRIEEADVLYDPSKPRQVKLEIVFSQPLPPPPTGGGGFGAELGGPITDENSLPAWMQQQEAKAKELALREYREITGDDKAESPIPVSYKGDARVKELIKDGYRWRAGKDHVASDAWVHLYAKVTGPPEARLGEITKRIRVEFSPTISANGVVRLNASQTAEITPEQVPPGVNGGLWRQERERELRLASQQAAFLLVHWMNLWRIRAPKEAESAFAAGQTYPLTRHRRFWGKEWKIQLKLEGQVKLEIDKPLGENPPSEETGNVNKPSDVNLRAHFSRSEPGIQIKSHHGSMREFNLKAQPNLAEHVSKSLPVLPRSGFEQTHYRKERTFWKIAMNKGGLQKLISPFLVQESIPKISGVLDEDGFRMRVIQNGRKIRLVVEAVSDSAKVYGWQIGDEAFRGEIAGEASDLNTWIITGQFLERYPRRIHLRSTGETDSKELYPNLADFWFPISEGFLDLRGDRPSLLITKGVFYIDIRGRATVERRVYFDEPRVITDDSYGSYVGYLPENHNFRFVGSAEIVTLPTTPPEREPSSEDVAAASNIKFVDAEGKTVEGSTSFSDPRPIVTLKDLGPSDVRVEGDTASITLSGSVTDAIADIVDRAADILEVVIEYRKRGPDERWALVTERVQVEKQRGDAPTSLRPFPFEGVFSKTIQLPLAPGSSFVSVRADNAIKNSGYDSFSLNFSQGDSTPLRLERVTNHESTLPGLVNPVRVQISDPALTAYAFSGTVSLSLAGSGTSPTAAFKLLVDGEQVWLDRPLMAVAREFPSAPSNVFRADLLPGPIRLSYKGVERSLSWGYTAQSPPVYPKYASGTTVQHWIWDYSFQFGIDRDQVKVERLVGREWVEDTEIKVTVEQEVSGPKPGVRVKLQIPPSAWRAGRERRCRFFQEHGPGGGPQTFSLGNFEVVPLRTVIVTVDGLAYDSFAGLLAGKKAPYFKRVFGEGVDAGKKVLSALPTVTYCNWPGVFSGMPPRDHGIVGNSFFERERRDVWPFLSADDRLVGGDVSHAAFAVLFGFNSRAKDGAGSLYDQLAAVRPKPERLHAASLYQWYYRHGERVEMDPDDFPTQHPSPKHLGHNAETAAYQDGLSGEDSRRVFAARSSELDVLTVYFAGPDNVAHGVGATPAEANFSSGPALPNVADPLTAIKTQVERVTDREFGKLVDQIQLDGYLSATLFALTADHGLHAYHNTPDFTLGLGNCFADVFKAVGLDPWRGARNFGWDKGAKNTVAYSPNGGMGQIYLRDDNGTWQQPPSRDRILAVARALYVQALGGLSDKIDPAGRLVPYDRNSRFPHVPRLCGQLAPKNNPAVRGVGVDGGALGRPPAIFVRVGNDGENHFTQDFQWVKDVVPDPQPNQEDVVLGEIWEFEAARRKVLKPGAPPGSAFDWPEFAARIDEMNDKNPKGSRTGDILIFMDGAMGYLTVNDGDGYNGWHGGATISESYVPIVLSMPGGAFVDRAEVNKLLDNAIRKVGRQSLRNWHLAEILKNVHVALIQ